jgi:hypothetical protein
MSVSKQKEDRDVTCEKLSSKLSLFVFIFAFVLCLGKWE